MRADTNIKNKMETLHDLVNKLDESEKSNLNLRQEVSSLKKLLHGQGKALNKFVTQNDYPEKIK